MQTVNSNTIARRKTSHVPGMTDLSGILSASEAIQKICPSPVIETPIKKYVFDDNGIEHSDPIEGYKCLSIIKNNEVKDLGVVQNSFTTVQPSTIGEILDPYIEQGNLKLVCGGMLHNDTRISLIAEIPMSEREIVKGEIVTCHLNMYSGLTGNLKFGSKMYALILRCLNGATSEDVEFSFSTKHTKNVHARLGNVSHQIDATIKKYEQEIEKFKFLAAKKMNTRDMEQYIFNVFEVDQTKELPTKTLNKMSDILSLLHNQIDMDLVPAMRGTAYQAYSAVTEYLTYNAGRNEETRLNSRLFGEANNLNKKALELALRA